MPDFYSTSIELGGGHIHKSSIIVHHHHKMNFPFLFTLSMINQSWLDCVVFCWTKTTELNFHFGFYLPMLFISRNNPCLSTKLHIRLTLTALTMHWLTSSTFRARELRGKEEGWWVELRRIGTRGESNQLGQNWKRLEPVGTSWRQKIGGKNQVDNAF